MEITKGRYRLGQSVSSTSKYNEVNKTFQTTDNGANIKEGRSLSLGKVHIWPSYELENAKDKTFTFIAPALSEWGHMQGEFQFINGIDPSNLTLYYNTVEIDPAGGHGQIRFNARESSLWHRLKVKIRVTIVNVDSSEALGTSLPGEISFPAGTKTYLYDDGAKKDLKETKTCNTNLIISEVSSTYSNNNIYFATGDDDTEYETTYDDKILEYTIDFNQSHTTQHGLIDPNAYDYVLDYEISANNDVRKKAGFIELVSYYAYDDGTLREYPLDVPIVLASWRQRQNILYYVNMAWVSKPTSKDSMPSVVDSSTVEYNDTTFNLYLFVELGVSPNGGHDIYWNQVYKQGANSLSAVLPSDISKYITIYKNDDVKPGHINNYGDFTVQTMWSGGNYVKVTGTSLPNTEANNKDRVQHYYVKNMYSHGDDYIHDDHFSCAAAKSDRTENRHGQYSTFNVRKMTDTNPWNINITATLEYEKYSGATDGLTIEERKNTQK